MRLFILRLYPVNYTVNNHHVFILQYISKFLNISKYNH